MRPLIGVPGHIRSDDGPEFVARAVQGWVTAVGAETAHIEPGSPWGNGRVGSLDARLRDERLGGEASYPLAEAEVVIEGRRHHDTGRPHPALGYEPPAPDVVLPPTLPRARAMAPRPVAH